MIKINSKYRLIIVGVLIMIAFVGGYVLRGGTTDEVEHVSHEHDESENTVWTCSMHPQIRQPAPGDCPICAMDLIPITNDNDDENSHPRQLKLSPTAIQLAEIQTAPAERKALVSQLRLVGKIEYDETRLGAITAWVGGRIDKLYVDYTGTTVGKGQSMVDIYSPELLTLQQEFLQAIRFDSSALIDASRRKLELFGLAERQIQEIKERGHAVDQLTIFAPMGGVVIQKNAVEGVYIKTGTEIYTIADLSTVWVKIDAYESDLNWLKEGQQIEITTEAYPNESFMGQIEFIDPVLNPKTRTVKIRASVPNPRGRLKPEMFVRAMIQAGQPSSQKRLPLVIPASAPLITGKRAVVYVADPHQDGVFTGREVVLSSRVGDHYVVKRGLSEGEEVVINGNFKIDSALQILAKPSMMMPNDSTQKLYQAPLVFKNQLGAVYTTYFEIQQALSQDNLEESKTAGVEMAAALADIDPMQLDNDAQIQWQKYAESLKTNAEGIGRAKVIDIARTKFKNLSQTMINLSKQFDINDHQSVLVFHCPMAFGDRGADWLQNKTGVENPYFGSQMFRCGEQTETIIP